MTTVPESTIPPTNLERSSTLQILGAALEVHRKNIARVAMLSDLERAKREMDVAAATVIRGMSIDYARLIVDDADDAKLVVEIVAGMRHVLKMLDQHLDETDKSIEKLEQTRLECLAEIVAIEELSRDELDAHTPCNE